MKRVLVLVEGQTEEAFVNTALAPHLAGFERWPEATRICTKRVAERRAYRGGIGSYAQVRSDLRRLLGSNPDVVTTLIDYYGLPDDFPGMTSVPKNQGCFARVAHLERAFAEDVADGRFFPGIVLHEFEGLLFSRPRAIAEALLDDAPAEKLESIARAYGSPEEIDDSPETHPSRRIRDLYAAYQKALHGPQIVLKIGLPTIRSRCKHFDRWLTRLETW